MSKIVISGSYEYVCLFSSIRITNIAFFGYFSSKFLIKFVRKIHFINTKFYINNFKLQTLIIFTGFSFIYIPSKVICTVPFKMNFILLIILQDINIVLINITKLQN